MHLISPAFQQGQSIPSKYTCQGDDINPPFVISGVPDKAQSLVLIMDDPDVPPSIRKDGIWVHWIVFNIDPNLKKIEESAENIGVMGRNTAGKNQYMGPCPPDREHRYFFKIYALDAPLDLEEGTTKQDLLKAMEGHILDQTELMGVYNKF